MTDNPYESPKVAEPAVRGGRLEFRFRKYHFVGMLWCVIMIGCCLYLARFEQIPADYRVFWPVSIGLMGPHFTLLVLLPCFAIRILYLLYRQRFPEAAIDAAFSGVAFVAMCSGFWIYPIAV